jgi:hypothetical protein
MISLAGSRSQLFPDTAMQSFLERTGVLPVVFS